VRAVSHTDLEPARRARRGLAIYFTIVLALSAVIQAVIISRPDLDGLIAGFMLVPTVASVVARLTLKEGFSDVSFRLGGRRGGKAIMQALIFPVVIRFVAYGIGWTTGLAWFDPPPLGALIGVFAGGLVVSLVVVSGEEIGWRGYMLTRLIDSGVPRPVLASGLIWALWHVPLVLAGVYAAGPSPVISAVLLVVGITLFGYVIARMRLEAGSIWPAIVLHTAWNTIIIRGFDPATTGSGAMLWVGESGIVTTLALVAAAGVYSRGRWTILHEPPKRERVPLTVSPRT